METNGTNGANRGNGMSESNIIPFPGKPRPSKYEHLTEEIFSMVFDLGPHISSGRPFSRETEALVQELSDLVRRVSYALELEADALLE